MLYCEKCGVSISGDRRRCPLCQSRLTGTGDPASETFPALPDRSETMSLIIRAMVFLSIAAVVLCSSIDALLPESVKWSYYVVAAVACMWFCIANVLLRRHNLPKNILWMAFLISLLALAWDFFTGWHHWSLDYVIPSVLVFALIAVAVISKAMRKQFEDYMIYLIIDALFGIIPLLFLLMDWVRVTYPSIVCVAVSLLSLAALCTFESEQIRAEIKKRLHL